MSFSEEQRQALIQEQRRESVERRFRDPERDPELENIWTVYVWSMDDPRSPERGEWVLAGFRRRRARRRRPQTMGRFFAKIRRQLQLSKDSHLLVMDLGMAQRHVLRGEEAWRFRPPQFQQRKAKMVQQTPELWVTKKFKRRATDKAYKLNRKTTAFFALGRNPWDRKPGYLYLGPLKSSMRMNADREARRMYGLYKELLVLKVSELSASMQNKMQSGKRVIAGQTRIIWPEVPPTFDEMWRKFVKRLLRKVFFDAIAPTDLRLVDLEMALRAEWEFQARPWLSVGWFYKQIKRDYRQEA